MVQITFVQPDGSRTTVDADVGASVMETAVNNGVEGIFAECGGAMMCATCHCYVDDAWSEKTGSRNDGEEEMLECAAGELRGTSRLSCQLKVSGELDGLVVHLPEEQG
ncbi:2Fe-2S iron-sulfur cluster-binding protein [Roseibium salinum]|uniref:2Fe-2S iron-sulfur cluster-binding protein n=1 Tax=Roseibium salinum TaxID=1604349 RepID=A0ABT3QX09_9HYPH|nr:2Fe-2S iron-sulfur cluster-binding protein [Roseibium sp. DSM 29163]MCX2721435.1 2Fe-2S iron-sulfur cluster-binding protein [Roseibium sp. DSM 29163]MDN3721909.1 2Fe-2S iron-sulfur cluster-binding protein [Roseibium salinum]